MACLYCGKRVSMVRQMADPDFCSDEHRRRYGDMARAALSRLMEFGAAEVAESPGVRGAVSGPALVERPASEPKRPAGRRDAAAAKTPRLAPVPVTPPERGILVLELGACDIAASLWPYAAYEFAPAMMCFDIAGAPAVSVTPPALFEDLVPLSQRLNAHGPFRPYAAPGMPEREIALPARRGAADEALPGVASTYGFRRVQGSARRRFARPRPVPAPKFAPAAVSEPVAPWRIEPLGVPAAPPVPHPARRFSQSASKPVPVELALPAPAVRLPAVPGEGQKRVPAATEARRDVLAAIEARGDFGFRTMAPPLWKGVGSPTQAGGGLAVREAVLPSRPERSGAPAQIAVGTTLPLHAIVPSAGSRKAAPPVDSPQPAPRFHLAARPSVRLSCAVPELPLLPVATSPERSKGQRAAAVTGGVFTAASAGGAWQQMQRTVRPAEARASTDAFGPLPIAVRPMVRKAGVRECTPAEAAPPPVHIPRTAEPPRRAAGLASLAAPMPWVPKARAVASEFRLQPVQLTPDPVLPSALPASHGRPGVRQIRAGYFHPEPPGPHGGERKPRPATLDFEGEPGAPAHRRAERLGVGANIASASAAPSAAPRASNTAPALRSDSTEFVAGAPRWSLRSSDAFRHEIPAAARAPERLAPACRAAMPAPGTVAVASRPVVLPRTGLCGPGTPAGVRSLSLRDTPSKPAQAAAIFRREPASAPEFRPGEVRLPVPAPARPARRTLNILEFKPAPAAAILRMASQASVEAGRDFGTAIPLPGRDVRIRAAACIGTGLEVRLPVRAPVITGRSSPADAAVPVAAVVLPPALGAPRVRPSVVPAPLSPVRPRRGDREETRMPVAAAAALRYRPLRTIHVVMPLDAAATPRMTGPKAGVNVRPARRHDAARPEITTGKRAVVVVLPGWRISLRRPGHPAVGFTPFEFAEHDEIRNAVTRMAELPLLQPVLPRCAGPGWELTHAPRVAGVLNGYPGPLAGVPLPAEADPVIRTEIPPEIIPFKATPEVEDELEALAPAVPDIKPRRVWRTGSRFFR